jgi:leader peptidase (prepilin peptidase)/N-methyltransferase
MAPLLSIILLIVSPFIGSFLACLADRMPAARPLVAARSACDHCDEKLAPVDLIPLLSWCLNGAKCRYCRTRISVYYPVVELAALSVVISALAFTSGPIVWVTIGLGWTLLTLAAMDLRHMVLADSLNLALAVSGLAAALVWSQLPISDHLLGMLLGPVALYLVNLIYRFLRGPDGLGMGDVKFMAGAGAWLGWQGLPSVVLYASLAALLAVLVAVPRSKLKRNTAIPFGAFLCLGLWLTWLIGPINVLVP